MDKRLSEGWNHVGGVFIDIRAPKFLRGGLKNRGAEGGRGINISQVAVRKGINI